MVARFGNLETVFKKMDENGDGVLDREALFSLTFCVFMTVYACIYACACHETLFSLFGSTTRARACMCHVRARDFSFPHAVVLPDGGSLQACTTLGGNTWQASGSLQFAKRAPCEPVRL